MDRVDWVVVYIGASETFDILYTSLIKIHY